MYLSLPLVDFGTISRKVMGMSNKNEIVKAHLYNIFKMHYWDLVSNGGLLQLHSFMTT